MSSFEDHQTDTVGVSRVVEEAREALVSLQRPDGHWVFELEADSTISSEYIFLRHFLGEVDMGEEQRIASYLRRKQADHGGWPLFTGGDLDLSATVKAYFALKLAGDSPDAPHMCRAREEILRRGGAGRSNVFTRINLALFGQIDWRAVPVMPVELMLCGQRAPFHLSKVSYWSRTVIAPLLILMACKPRARNPRGVGIQELFPPSLEKECRKIPNPTGTLTGRGFIEVDRLLRMAEPFVPSRVRSRALDSAMTFIRERLNGEDGLGAIFPAMVNAVMAFAALGYRPDHPEFATARRAVRALLVHGEDETYCQPCLSPLWDTALSVHALLEAGSPPEEPVIASALAWLAEREITHVAGDYRWNRPRLEPSGWAFQYRNDIYPDTDDTAMVVMALHRAAPDRYRDMIRRGAEWIIGMQNRNGGWGAFDADNTCYYLNYIPFADHGALLDPPTVDVTSRCLGMLAQLGYPRTHPAVAQAVDFLLRGQESDGSWHGRWGVNYIYGTWSALSALAAAGEHPEAPHIRRAVRWLLETQNEDGGWGEHCGSYMNKSQGMPHPSTPSQTAWALLGLMAAGEDGSTAVRRGVHCLESAPRQGARWNEEYSTGVGFPSVFYLKYHGYSSYFPIWALARYYNYLHARGNGGIRRYGI